MEKLKANELHHTYQVHLKNGKTAFFKGQEKEQEVIITISLSYKGAYGMGEKFNGINQKNKRSINQVEEKFCEQGEKSYCAAPFFFTDSGFGLYVDTMKTTIFEFFEEIYCTVPGDSEIIIFTGTPESIISEYMSVLGKAKCPPKFAFGPWISANHWDSQEKTERQLQVLKELDFPATVLVLEAWSDEATFYIFNGADYQPVPDGRELSYEDFDFSKSPCWKNPKELIEKIHAQGLHLILWQIPVYKKMQTDEAYNEQNRLDLQDALRRSLCVRRKGGTPYSIPEGNWFAGSLIPDFTNLETKETWFKKRQYLLDMGVDGFKTDGGEFIYTEDVVFSDGTTGREGKNQYCRDYETAYTEFIGSSRILFSRAGFAGAHTTPIHWAGDQKSTNEEFKHVLGAGLSAALTGIIFWGFDIGGFAGPLPSLDLYRRATQLACFSPIMQWHSEPIGGQFRELLPGEPGNNERSPWNLAAVYEDESFIKEMRYWHHLRMRLLPYLYSTAKDCAENNRPMMRPLIYEWPEDRQVILTEDEFCLGDSLLIAPLMEEGQEKRDFYLPGGDWYGFFSKEPYQGETQSCSFKEKFPVFIRKGCAVALAVGKETQKHLHFLLAGESGTYHFRDDGNDLFVTWGKYGVTFNGNVEEGITWEIL